MLEPQQLALHKLCPSMPELGTVPQGDLGLHCSQICGTIT
jgi:hypothetical protein